MLHKNIRLLTFFNFFLDFRLFAPVAVLYFQKVTGSFALGMAVFSLVFISSALFEIPTGIFSDKIGRKKTIVLGTLATITALVLYALGSSAIVLYIGAIFDGLGRSLYSGNNDALLHATLKESHQENEYHVFLGKTSSMFQLASAVASIAGGILAYWSFSLVMWFSVIPAMICFMLALLMSEPKIAMKATGNIYSHLFTSIKKFKENKKLRLLSIARMIDYGMGDAGFEFQAAFYSMLWPTWALGIARTIANTFAATSFYISGKVINKFSAIKMLLLESIFSPLVKILATLIITPFSPILMASMSFLYGFGQVAGSSLQQKEFSDEQRATMSSLVSLGGSIVLAVSSFTLGLIADRWGVIAAIIFAQMVLFTTNFFYIKVYRLSK